MVNSTKHALNSAGGIALRSGGVIKAGAAVAMRRSLRAARSASSSNRPDCVEDLLRVGGILTGRSPGQANPSSLAAQASQGSSPPKRLREGGIPTRDE